MKDHQGGRQINAYNTVTIFDATYWCLNYIWKKTVYCIVLDNYNSQFFTCTIESNSLRLSIFVNTVYCQTKFLSIKNQNNYGII